MKFAGALVITVGWGAYLGGLLVMELVWRPVQAQLPPSQTGALCNVMGRRYRWMALAALGLTAAGELVSGTRPGWPFIAGWVVLVALVGVMGAYVHPLSHRRWRASASTVEETSARRRRRGAIRVMQIALRVEFVIALAVAVSVASSLSPGAGH